MRRLARVVLASGCLLAAAERGAAQVKVLFEFLGEHADEGLGNAVDGAGDVNGDGVPDVIISGGLNDDPPFAPGVRVLSGADGSDLLSLYPEPGRSAVAGIGDIDGDGRSDFAVARAKTYGGHADVYSGASGTVLFSDDGVSPPFGSPYLYAWSVNPAGDVD